VVYVTEEKSLSFKSVGKDGINSIAYLDMTNHLYGAVMMQSLPYELLPGFYEVTVDQMIMEYNLESDLGFFV
jgi:TRAP-type mannitol/chloroaromatic compound transport system permease small subunit